MLQLLWGPGEPRKKQAQASCEAKLEANMFALYAAVHRWKKYVTVGHTVSEC